MIDKFSVSFEIKTKYLDSKAFFDESFREEYMKPGFENFADSTTVKPSADVDLDGEIYGKFIFWDRL